MSPLGSSDAKCLLTPRPSRAVSLPVPVIVYTRYCHILLSSLKANTHFTTSEGRVGRGTAITVCSPSIRLYMAVVFTINTERPWMGLDPGILFTTARHVATRPLPLTCKFNFVISVLLIRHAFLAEICLNTPLMVWPQDLIESVLNYR